LIKRKSLRENTSVEDVEHQLNLKWTALEEAFHFPIKDSDYVDELERRYVCLIEINKERNKDKGTLNKDKKPKTLN